MTRGGSSDEPGGADELTAARDALVGADDVDTVSAEIDDLRRQLRAEQQARARTDV